MKRQENLSLEEVKSVELGILDYIVSLCKENSIPYYLSYGSLLGAIRHKGFIPWDDDIDISLLRPDYDRLIKALTDSNNKRYKLLHPSKKDYLYSFSKVVDTKTKVVEDNIDNTNDMGVWVDVFPLDGVKKRKSFHAKILHFYNECRAAAICQTLPSKYSKWMYLPWLCCRIIGPKFFLNRVVKLSQKYDVNEVSFVSHMPTAFRRQIPREIFNTTTKVEFEGRLYDAPSDYDAYLKLHYGANYMQLPPIEYRVSHCLKAIWK